MATAAPTISAGPGPVTRPANLYTLHGNTAQGSEASLYVVYALSGPGAPFFQYRDPSRSLSFSGDQIRVTESPLGNLVTVTTDMTTDTGGTTFTLVVPTVALVGPSLSISTFGVTTTHRGPVNRGAGAAPDRAPAGGLLPNLGQLELYTVTALAGTAESVARQ